MKHALFAAALGLALLVPWPALAQEAAPCVKRSDFLAYLERQFDERPAAFGVTAGGWLLELVASASGSWTIIVTMPNGTSCGIASGSDWQQFRPDPFEDAT